jgi:hypothetical protein
MGSDSDFWVSRAGAKKRFRDAILSQESSKSVWLSLVQILPRPGDGPLSEIGILQLQAI